MRWRDSEMRDSVRETIRRVRTELRQKKRRASWSFGLRAHGPGNESKKLFAKHNSSLYERFMETTIKRTAGHRGPNPGVLAIVYTLLFNFGLYFVVSFRMPEHLVASSTAVRPYFPGPWESAQTIVAYFQPIRMRS